MGLGASNDTVKKTLLGVVSKQETLATRVGVMLNQNNDLRRDVKLLRQTVTQLAQELRRKNDRMRKLGEENDRLVSTSERMCRRLKRIGELT
jgi:regulator of replication initiation timing